jgi:hypothetical protein
MKNLLTEILALLIALFLLFGAGCTGKTEWFGVPPGVGLSCGSTGKDSDVLMCIGSDRAVYTCVRERRSNGDEQITCLRTAEPPPAEAR